jgi:hypothetical protein
MKRSLLIFIICSCSWSAFAVDVTATGSNNPNPDPNASAGNYSVSTTPNATNVVVVPNVQDQQVAKKLFDDKTTSDNFAPRKGFNPFKESD